jgi:hypothetical protein
VGFGLFIECKQEAKLFIRRNHNIPVLLDATYMFIDDNSLFHHEQKQVIYQGICSYEQHLPVASCHL